MTCLTCANAEVLFFCRACRHGTCLDCYHDASNHCSCNSIYLCSTVPDADIPAPLGEHEREEVTAEIDFTIPFAAESEGWRPDDRYAGRLHRLQEIKDLVLGGGSTGYAAMDRIVLEGVSKYHYTNHPTYKTVPFPRLLNIGTNSLMWHHTQSFGQAAFTTPTADIPARRCDKLSS